MPLLILHVLEVFSSFYIAKENNNDDFKLTATSNDV